MSCHAFKLKTTSRSGPGRISLRGGPVSDHVRVCYPATGELRPALGGAARIDPEEYMREGRRSYGLAAATARARDLGLSELFGLLEADFDKAQKPLSYVAVHYLHLRRQHLFI